MLEVNSLTKSPSQQLERLSSKLTMVSDFNNSNSIDFKDILNDVNTVNNQNILNELIIQFEKQDKIVSKKPSISNLTEYKKIIGRIISIAAKNYSNTDITVHSREGFEKVLNYSKVIDEKTELIVKDFLENNKLSLKSLEYMDEIKGLILDIRI